MKRDREQAAAARERTFFYAYRDAECYDLTEALTQRLVDVVHDEIVGLLLRTAERPAALRVLDLGAGTGAQTLRILKRHPLSTVVAVDFSPAMIGVLADKATRALGRRTWRRRLTIVERDFLASDSTADLLKSLGGEGDAGRQYDAVVCGFVLHHYDPVEKARAYRLAHEALGEGGVLIHGDLFSFRSPTLTRLAHAVGREWIDRQFSRPSKGLRRRWERLGPRREELREQWLEHWDNTHILAPMGLGPVQGGGREGGEVWGHLQALKEVGFREMGVPVRLWEAGVIWARK